MHGRRNIPLAFLVTVTLIASACTGGGKNASVGSTPKSGGTPSVQSSPPEGRLVYAVPNGEGFTVFVVNADGTGDHRLASGDTPRWSPDGRRIAFHCCPYRSAADIVNPGTGRDHKLFMPDPAVFTACTIWSPNAARLACFGHGEHDPALDGIYTIRSADGKGLTRVESNPGGGDNPADYSPDGTHLVFDRINPSRPANKNSAVFVVNLDGSGLHRISPWFHLEPDDVDGTWSPDGSTIAYSRDGALYLVSPDGTGTRRLPIKEAGWIWEPTWSPDGTKLAFQKNTDIYISDADGTHVVQVTHNDKVKEWVDWGLEPSP